MVVVGASAGGVEALRELVHGLPADLPAAMVVALHMSPGGRGALARILQRVAALEVRPAEDMAPVRRGYVYVARPDYHLLLRDGELRLSRGPRENGHRPAVDPLFRSAARWYAARTVAVVLSGLLDDGAAGALAVARRGGTIAVQDPADAMYDGMPRAALRAVGSALVASAAELPHHLDRLVREPPGNDLGEVTADLQLETDLAELAGDALHRPDRPGVPSGLGCPDCGGVLYRLDERPGPRYRCRVGHAWSPESLATFKDQEVEDAMWIAVRNLEERTAFYRDLAGQAHAAGRARSSASYRERQTEASRAAEVIRGLLASGRLGLGERAGDQG
jgi:two-component system chemotaxis response regulator CheB